MNTDLNLFLEFEPGIKSVDVVIQDCDGNILSDIKQLHNQPVKVDCKIKLPNKISIILNNQNNKFVKLSNLWLGNIEINPQVLLQLCEFKPTHLDTTEFSTIWNANGIVSINIFDKDFTLFLLHYHNHIKL